MCLFVRVPVCVLLLYVFSYVGMYVLTYMYRCFACVCATVLVCKRYQECLFVAVVQCQFVCVSVCYGRVCFCVCVCVCVWICECLCLLFLLVSMCLCVCLCECVCVCVFLSSFC